MEESETSAPFERLLTGIPGLDLVLGGGFVRGGAYVMVGGPGTGKTSIAAQVAVNVASGGGRVVFVTVLSESVGRLLLNLGRFAFFRPELVGGQLQFLSAYTEIDAGGTGALVTFVRDLVRKHQATLLVFDGLADVHLRAESPLEFRKFVHELHARLDALGCTALMLSTDDSIDVSAGAPAATDGIVELVDREVNWRAVRELRVVKHRGVAHLRGWHAFDITREGVAVFPRLTSLGRAGARLGATPPGRDGFDLARLDAMLDGGLPVTSCTAIAGAMGSGRTLLGLHFLAAGARRGERSLYFGLHEPTARLEEAAAGIGLDLAPLAAGGQLLYRQEADVELLLDAFGAELLELVERHGIRRLFIDSLDALVLGAAFPDRTPSFLVALLARLRARGVTTVLSATLPEPGQGPSAVSEAASAAENLVVLRHDETRSRQRRLISIAKLRGSGFDSGIHEFAITSRGIRIGAHEIRKAERGADRARPAGSRAPEAGRRRGQERRR